MRYTTIIDLSEFPELYRNRNIRDVYVHLVLKSGYHDDDRDQVHTSQRRLSAELGISLNAVRHALRQLIKAELLYQVDGKFFVKKWVIQSKAPARTSDNDPMKAAAALIRQRQKEEEHQEWERKARYAISTCTKEQATQWLEELKHGTRKAHKGISLAPCEDNIRQLESYIRYLEKKESEKPENL